MKKYDLCVAKRKYTDSQGNQKSEWLNIGVVLEKEGKQFIIMDRTFNPAGMPQDGKDGIIVSMFEPKMKEDGYQAAKQAVADDSEIPF